ncbi:hypothetical protein Fot_01266 [Forsythia ovata]|uniref:Uncharacterized protein n=1 Tax=Forsythia ovata TaxID=205694 RepID=A0ABD1X3G5_9LAMI
MKEVLPNLYEEGVYSSWMSYPLRSYQIIRMRSYLQPLWRGGSFVKDVLQNHTNEVYPTFVERGFTHQGGLTYSGPTESPEGGPTPSNPTDSHEGDPTESYERGPTYNMSYPTSIEREFHR